MKKSVSTLSPARVWGGRAAALIVFLLAWELLPKIEWLRQVSPAFDPFFISSPTRVLDRLIDLCFGLSGQPIVWPMFLQTALGMFIGVGISLIIGVLGGLVLSNNAMAQKIAAPFLALANATPRVALIPLFVIIAGTTLTTTVLTVVVVVVFLVFYNAYSGGLSVPPEVVQNARILGARPLEIMRRVRLPYVLVWTFSALPNAISFGLVVAVTAEILMGRIGMGRLLADSMAMVDSTLTFSVVVMLGAFGVTIVSLAQMVQVRVLHWWQG